jgi:hypothetical protein
MIERDGMIRESVEINAMRYIIESNINIKNTLSKIKGVKESTFYLLDNAGNAITDTQAEVVLSNFMRSHFARTYGAVAYSSIEKPHGMESEVVNPHELFKLFKTVAQITMSDLSRKKEIIDRYGMSVAPGM